MPRWSNCHRAQPSSRHRNGSGTPSSRPLSSTTKKAPTTGPGGRVCVADVTGEMLVLRPWYVYFLSSLTSNSASMTSPAAPAPLPPGLPSALEDAPGPPPAPPPPAVLAASAS